MTKIKLCGLTRTEDIDWANEARPDYCGFIINVSHSRRNITPARLRELCSRLHESVIPVGVFVNEPLDSLLALAAQGILGAVQLHGTEDDHYIRQLKKEITIPVIKAFQAESPKLEHQVENSPADLILLDSRTGGSGYPFDWTLVKGIRRPFFLAGGLTPDSLTSALQTLHPWGVDMSSGIETNGFKDREKILAAVAAVRRNRS